MKFRCERDTLSEALGTAQRAVGSRGGALPVLSGVLLELQHDQLVVTGTDLELTIRSSTPVEGGGVGSAVLPARLLGDIVRSVEPGVVSMEILDDEARISAGRSEFTVRTLGVGEFPRQPEPEGQGVTIDGASFSEALRQVIPAASKDDARPILSGILLAAEGEGLRLVATDSYRLAVRDLPAERVLGAEERVLIPARGLSEVQRLLGNDPIQVVFSDRDVAFHLSGARITARLIEGQFPNYRQLLPSSYPNHLTVSREGLLDAVRRVRLVTQGRENTPVRLSLSTSGIELEVQAHEVGQAHETVDGKYEGEDMVVAFNPDFLIDGLQAVGGPEVVLETIDALKPVTARGTDGSGFLYLLMPVRVP